jgi:hypothetical protein
MVRKLVPTMDEYGEQPPPGDVVASLLTGACYTSAGTSRCSCAVLAVLTMMTRGAADSVLTTMYFCVGVRCRVALSTLRFVGGCAAGLLCGGGSPFFS